MASAMAGGSVDAMDPEPIPGGAFVREAVGSALLYGSLLVIARVFGPVSVDQSAGTALVVALVNAAIVCATVTVFARTSRSLLSPNGAFVQSRHGPLSRNDAAYVVLVQLLGAGVAGLVVGACGRAPIAMASELWSAGSARECVAACALGLAARLTNRDRITSLAWVGGFVMLATLAGARFLGNPALVLGNAFTDVLRVNGESIGAVLGAHMVGIVLALLIPLPATSSTHGVATPADGSR